MALYIFMYPIECVDGVIGVLGKNVGDSAPRAQFCRLDKDS